MTVVVPSSVPGPKASLSSGDAAHARRNAGTVDFATALSETAADAGEEPGVDEVKEKARGIPRPAPRAVHRRDAAERAIAKVGTPATAQNTDIRADVAAGGNLASVPDAAMSIVAEDAALSEVSDAAPANQAVASNAIPALQSESPRSNPVREALAVLNADFAAKRDTAAPSGEPTPQTRRQPFSGGPMSTIRRPEVATGQAGALHELDMPGDVPDIAATPIRVIRQETHFQPVAHEARRLLGMSAGASDERVLPLAVAATARISRPQALIHDGQGAPAVMDPVVDVAELQAPIAPDADGTTAGTIGQQIADGIQRAIGPPAESSTARSVPGADPAASPAFAPTLRSIKLQLNPQSLGVVTIMLTGHDGEMRVHLEAERAETFGKVEQERGALSARLNGAGYAISELTVGRMAAADGQGRDGDPREGAARHGGQTGGQQGDTAGGGAREGAAQFADQRAGRHGGSHAGRPNADSAIAAKGGAIEQTVSGVSYSGRFRPV